MQQLTRWTVACGVAETIGMTAAAAAAKGAQGLQDRVWLALALVVAGGLVEGTALGLAQGSVLAHSWPRLDRGRYLLLTVLVAGLGWAAGAAPGVLAGGDGGAAPPLGLVLLGAAGIGVTLGALLGAVQASVLRPVVRHPWRWVAANAAAWPGAMVVIFLGASAPGDSWPFVSVVSLGAVTGALGGAALGLVSGLWLPSLDGQPLQNRAVLRLLASGRLHGRGLLGLAVRGRRTSRTYRFPAQYAMDGDAVVVVPGHARRKVWWRNLDAEPREVEVLLDGEWSPATATLLFPEDTEYAGSVTAYTARWPRVRVTSAQPVVRIMPGQHQARTPWGVSSTSRSTMASRVP